MEGPGRLASLSALIRLTAAFASERQRSPRNGSRMLARRGRRVTDHRDRSASLEPSAKWRCGRTTNGSEINGRREATAPRTPNRPRRPARPQPSGPAGFQRVAGSPRIDGGALADRLDDRLVARAAAVVALERVADLVVVGSGSRSSRSSAVMSIPGVQNPHWSPWCSTNAAWSGWRCSGSGARSSTVRDGRAVRLDREHRARLHRAAVEMHRAGAALRGVAADLRAGRGRGPPAGRRPAAAAARPRARRRRR